ncbi:APC family permease [Methanotorris igneus]|uniref:Amino acid permease-associated region n=1 Tax=Methanotorris igneus (strain DSM 5666 / JCM 11834 / Kol 5) TaxID=880724 RepID=F6BCH5_METIK|nr:APC family permease [Methanotorris igneus]AEF96186.1 amino acid permease-associated region [Methanotorris igneus Kol 5]
MKYLTLKDAVFLTITSIIGGGIFVLSPLTYLIAGKCAIYGWILVLMISMVLVLPFAYATTKITKSGGPYKYVMRIFGKKVGTIFAYTLWFAGVTAISAVVSFFSIIFNIYFNFEYVGIVLVIFLTLLIINGVKVVGNFLRIFGTLTVITLLFIIFSNKFDLSVFDAKVNLFKVLVTSYFGLWTMTGWEGISIPSEAFKNPERDIGYGLIIGTFIIGILYLLYTLVVISSNITYSELGDVIGALIGNNSLIWVCILLIIGGCVFSWLFSLGWMPYALSHDKIFIPKFSDAFVKLRKGIPTNGVLLNSFIIATLSIYPSKTLVDLGMFLTLISYFVLYLSVFKEKVSAFKIKFVSLLAAVITLLIIAFRVYLLFNGK